MPNITQFPILPSEYVRIYPSVEAESITNIDIYPLKSFRVSTIEVAKLIHESVGKANQIFDASDTTASLRLLNHCFNTGLARLDEEGKVIMAEQPPPTDITEQSEGSLMAFTSDGYTVFNLGRLPPTPSAQTH